MKYAVQILFVTILTIFQISSAQADGAYAYIGAGGQFTNLSLSEIVKMVKKKELTKMIAHIQSHWSADRPLKMNPLDTLQKSMGYQAASDAEKDTEIWEKLEVSIDGESSPLLISQIYHFLRIISDNEMIKIVKKAKGKEIKIQFGSCAKGMKVWTNKPKKVQMVATTTHYKGGNSEEYLTGSFIATEPKVVYIWLPSMIRTNFLEFKDTLLAWNFPIKEYHDPSLGIQWSQVFTMGNHDFPLCDGRKFMK